MQRRNALAAAFAAVSLMVCIAASPGPHATHTIHLPADAAAHPDAGTEWWYVTGHLADDSGHTYGFETTFFRFAGLQKVNPLVPFDTLYRTDVALTDETAHRFDASAAYAAPLTGTVVSTTAFDVRAGTLAMSMQPGDTYSIQGHTAKGSVVSLTATPDRPAMLVGGGYIPFGDGGSYYYSYTHMRASGTLTISGRTITVHGASWMDHQWGRWSTRSVTGWTWMGVQLDDGMTVDLAVGRTHTGVAGDSGATALLPDNRQVTVTAVTISPLGIWRSPRTGTTYPSGWHVVVPSLRLDLIVHPTVRDQEVVDTNVLVHKSYWEGSCTVTGTRGGRSVTGKSYTELVGYDAMGVGRGSPSTP